MCVRFFFAIDNFVGEDRVDVGVVFMADIIIVFQILRDCADTEKSTEEGKETEKVNISRPRFE